MSISYSNITSRKNDKIILASKLADKKNRTKEGLFYTDGIKLLEEAILANLDIEKIFFTQKALSLYEETLEKANAGEYILVNDEVFEKLTDESAPQGVFACIKIPESFDFSESELNDGGFIILDDVQNPLNLGAIIRCAYSLGSAKIVLSKGCADIYNPKTLRSAMGSIFKAKIAVYDDISEFILKLRKCGNRVFCTHLHSDSLIAGSFNFSRNDSIVIGNEGHGVAEKTVSVCDNSVIIPMVENAESLNAATASSILIWEMNKSKKFNKDTI